LLVISLAGCAFEAGEGFATVESASLEVSFDAGSRVFPDGTLLVRDGYRLELEEIAIELAELSLVEARTSGGASIFDPAHPPPGYTLCHAGHCHHEDGRLVSYEDIQAELGGSATAFRDVVAMPIPDAIDLGEPRSLALSVFEPSRFLPATTLARASLRLTRLVVRGRIASAAAPAEAVELSIDLPLALSVLASLSPLAIDRDSPEELAITASFVLGPTLLDGVDYGALSDGGAIAITDEASAAGALIVEHLAEYPLAVAVDAR
jgi:hypothetical protein